MSMNNYKLQERTGKMTDNLVEFNENGDIVDKVSGKALKDTPEERVRQRFIEILQSDYGYPLDRIRREIPIQEGSKIRLFFM